MNKADYAINKGGRVKSLSSTPRFTLIEQVFFEISFFNLC